jgi:beta-1,4-mannosyltransferase
VLKMRGRHDGDNATAGSVKVMMSFHFRRDDVNPYLSQLVASLSREVIVKQFSWLTALSGDFDVLHVHWPEQIYRSRFGPITRIKKLATSLLLLRIQRSHRVMVRTLHNVHPHERGNTSEQRLLHRFDELTDMWITINQASTPPEGARSVLIRHGDYTAWFEGYGPGSASPVRERVLFFGVLRPYKGVETLLSSFGSVSSPSATLRIVGAPVSAEVGKFVKDATQSDPRISHVLEYVSDRALADEIHAAELVVLPYKEMHNSGAALLALSLGKPVLIVRNTSNEILAREVGLPWVHMFENLSGADIESALARSNSIAAGDKPDLGLRDWREAGVLHAEAYSTSLAAKARPADVNNEDS